MATIPVLLTSAGASRNTSAALKLSLSTAGGSSATDVSSSTAGGTTLTASAAAVPELATLPLFALGGLAFLVPSLH